MSAKKCCGCGLLSCFPCFSNKKSTLSAQPDSSEITNPSPAATLTVESFHQLSSSAPPLAAAPSRVNASTVMQNASQPIAPSDAVPSSFRGIVTPSALIPTTSQTSASPPTQPASSSTPSSSRLPKESDYAETIMEAVKELDKENDGDFSDLINYISRLLDFIEEKKKGKNQSMPKAAVGSCLASKDFLRLKDVVSEGVNAVVLVKDIVTLDGKTFLMGFLKGMGMAHMVTTGFLVAASILERHEAVSANKEACLYLLKQMNILAKYVQELQQRPALKKGMEAPIREATMLIVEASIDCCTQIVASKFSRVFSTTVNGEALAKFQKKLADTIDVRLRKGNELKYREYPKGAVGIEDPLREVIERLEMGSDKNAVAVIVHGFGGMGKTTLADAVFATLFDTNREGYKYSYVRLFDTIASTPNIVELQRSILTGLMMGEESEIPGIRRYEEGQQIIGDMLEKEAAFIYIDNVLLPDKVEQGRDALQQLLPRNMRNARKLRLLLNTRDKDAVRIAGVKTVFYSIQSLPKQEALYLFKKLLDDNSEKQLQAKQLKICKSEDLENLSEGSLHGMKAARSKDSIFELGASSSPNVSEVGYFSTRTLPTIPTESDYAENIREAVAAVEIETVDVNLSELSNYVSQLLNFRKEKKMENDPLKPRGAKYFLPDSKRFLKLKEFLSEGTNAVKGFIRGERKTFIGHFLEGMEMPHMVATGFLVQANVLERYESISTNKEACLSLLNEMHTLAQDVKELSTEPALEEAMKVSIREATTLIVEASLACCTQIDASKFAGFFLSTPGMEELAEIEKELQKMDTHVRNQMDLCLFDAVSQRESHFAKYPKYAGIKEPLQEVMELLELESYKNAVAVILHGIGGMGKTTLADAVFARLFEKNTEECKFYSVRLFQDTKSTPNVIELQKSILRKLKGEEPEEIRSYEEGQKQIALMLEKEEAFIYIDNVLLQDKREQGPDALTQLLPENMANAKKLRLLITTRNKDAASWMTMSKGVEKKFYEIQSLPKAEAETETLLEKELNGNESQLNASQIDGIVNICGGVPALLKVLAGFINGREGSAVQNYETLMREAKEKNWKANVGDSIDHYVFAYDKLEDELKDPFLDVCSFFRGWDWKELSDIVGDTKLKRLEQRALVTLDVKSMTARVPDVILQVGLQRTEGNRFRLTTATEIEKFLDVEDLQKIKGIWASDNKDPLRIPASKLDLMSGSLRVLKLGRLTDVEGKCEKKFKELVFFSAITSHLPFYVSKLKGFEKLRHLCYNPADLQNLSQMPSNLRHVDINLNSPSFQVSSNCIQRLRYLRVLRLSNAQFKCLPQELGDMGNGWEEVSISGCQYLEELSISGCQYLEKVSISTLKSLRVLRMDGCSGLTQLPKGLGSLTSLQELYLYGCKSLEALPSELENLTSLQKLDMSWCERLEALPSSLGKLRSLQELHLYRCYSLQALPNSLEELSLLRLLDLSWCTNIKNLPCGLGKLTSLVELELSCCGLSSIPENIGMLKLNSIKLTSASLKDLPDGFCDFSTLTELDMANCGVKELPERFGKVTSLRKLKLACCHSLQKLPVSFNQLKYLEHLDLSACSTLEELCKEFEGLSLLRVLSLEGCYKLKKLPEDFQCLTSLEVLDVRNCHQLEGKWIDNMLKMEKLQILRIAGSKLLEERWEKTQAQQCNQSWSCAVYTEQGLSNEENLLKQFQSKFDSMLTNGKGEPLNISGLPPDTLLLVMFDGHQDFDPDFAFPFPLLEKNIDDIQTNFQMVYFGNHWDHLPEKVANRIFGHAPANRDAVALFRSLLSLVVLRTDFDWQVTSSFQMSAKIVSGEKGDKHLSCWEFFEEDWGVEDFVMTKCIRYLKLKELTERPEESNIELLRNLLAKEKENSLSFLKKGAATKVGVDELKGKMILLDIRPANICFDITLQSLVEMYDAEKEKRRFDFEIITIQIMQDDSKWDVSVEFSREVPWLVLQNSRELTDATKHFLVDEVASSQGWDRWYPNIIVIIDSNGRIAKPTDPRVTVIIEDSNGRIVEPQNPGVLRMVNTWGAESYPFTEEKRRELIQNEARAMKVMSNSMFLFSHLESVSQQAIEATRQQKMTCLYSCHQREHTDSIKEALIELSNIICIIYIPNFRVTDPKIPGYLTDTFYEWYPTLEDSRMSQVEMQRMHCLSLSQQESIRFWARIYSLYEAKDEIADESLSKMLSTMTNGSQNHSWMFIMDENGYLITEGKEFLKQLCPNDEAKAKELMQRLIIGVNESWERTLFDDEDSLFDDGDSEGDFSDQDASFNSGTPSEDYVSDEDASLHSGTPTSENDNLIVSSP